MRQLVRNKKRKEYNSHINLRSRKKTGPFHSIIPRYSGILWYFTRFTKTPSSLLHNVDFLVNRLRDELINQRYTGLGRQLYFHGVLYFITRVFDHDLDSLSHFHFLSLIRDPRLLACQLIGYIVDL